MEIYVAMQGASEFTIGGVLKDWSICDRLNKFEVELFVTLKNYLFSRKLSSPKSLAFETIKRFFCFQ